jgi:hypothetical protein
MIPFWTDRPNSYGGLAAKIFVSNAAELQRALPPSIRCAA